eukprot:6199513-Alexandrium_andersonii.AAC.1
MSLPREPSGPRGASCASPPSTCRAGPRLPISGTFAGSCGGTAPGLSRATSTWTWGSRAMSERSRLPLPSR